MIKKSSISENFASKVPDSDGVVVVPAFTGLGAPYWEPECEGSDSRYKEVYQEGAHS